MTTLLDAILVPGALEVMFQPIVDCTSDRRTIFAFECLARGPAQTNARDAGVLFEYVRRKRAERLVDRLCVDNAFRHAHAVAPYDISVNVHGSTLSSDAGFSRAVGEMARAAGVDPRTVVVEIIEQSGVMNDQQFTRSLGTLRDAGFRIALDDVGLGQSNYKMIIETRPDFYKIDRYFVGAVGNDNRRAAVVESVLELAARLGGRVIAEGVESRQVEGVLRLLGVELLQGYLYAPPLAAIAATSFAAVYESDYSMEVSTR